MQIEVLLILLFASMDINCYIINIKMKEVKNMTIKFNLHNITNKETGLKTRVWYDLDNNINHSKCVCIHAKYYDSVLTNIFADAKNDSEYITDYVMTDKVTFTPDSPFYAAARATAEKLIAKRGW